MSELTGAGLSFFAMEHVCKQLEEFDMLDGMTDEQRDALDMDSIGVISKLAIRKSRLPVVLLLPYDKAMEAYENADAIHAMLS